MTKGGYDVFLNNNQHERVIGRSILKSGEERKVMDEVCKKSDEIIGRIDVVKIARDFLTFFSFLT